MTSCRATPSSAPLLPWIQRSATGEGVICDWTEYRIDMLYLSKIARSDIVYWIKTAWYMMGQSTESIYIFNRRWLDSILLTIKIAWYMMKRSTESIYCICGRSLGSILLTELRRRDVWPNRVLNRYVFLSKVARFDFVDRMKYITV